eukprot:TRINITY_DN1168_c0_g1_i1.p1 TRINITY_DN1168_c0_g1~~TRINITY_DN1168_c0_g1_i1.p1  ORF type:complete len:353 (-),score=115.85 TRINITY_DN1168_c0_g1_i1:61-1119(-)
MSEKKDKGKDPEDGVSRSKSRSDSKSKTTAEEKKQALEEVEDELSESDEEDDATPADKAGYIEIGKKKDKFKTVYAILSGGSLFYYKDIRDAKPAAPGISLKKSTLNKAPEGVKKDFAFSLDSKEGNVFFAVYSKKDLDEWTKALEANATRDETQPPERKVEAKRKEGVLSRGKKAMAGSIAASGIGKKVLKSVLNEETASLLEAVKKIITKQYSKKKADEVERNIIKIVVKAYMLMNNKKVDADEFIKADKPLRVAFDTLPKIYNQRWRMKPEQMKNQLAKCEASFKEAEGIITTLLNPHLSPKNMFRLASTFSFLGSSSFLGKAFEDASVEADVEKLVDAMDYYTQFNYD